MPNTYAPIPYFGQCAEYVTQVAPDVNGFCDVVINKIPLENQPLEPMSLQAIKVDYTKINSIDAARIPNVTSAGLTTLKTNVGTIYYSDVVRYATDSSANALQIVTKLVEVSQRPNWKIGLVVAVNDVYLYPTDKNLYQCVQAHTTQSDWTPPICKALWKRFYEPSDTPWPWVQPIGSVDAYPVGAKVTYGGFTWQNTIAANVWQPGVTGWTNLTPPVTQNWTYPVAYKIGDQVTYLGHTYQCLQAHTSQAGWHPDIVPALWKLLS